MDHLHQESKVSVGPSNGEFTPGLQIEGHSRFGSEYDTEVAHMSDTCKSAAAVFGVRLSLNDESVGGVAVETLNGLFSMVQGVDQVKEVLDKGVDISFRHEGKSVWINVAVPNTLPELQMVPGWDNINLANTQYGGKMDWKVTSGVDPTKFLDAKIEDFVDMASNFSVEAEGNFEELHHVITTGTNLVKQLFGDSSKEINMVLALVNVLTAFRKFNLDFKYDSSVVKSVIKNLIEGSGKSEKIQSKVSGNQEMANQFLPQAQMMAPMFIGPYSDLLKNVNLGHYEFFLMVPKLRLYIRPGFTLFGLNTFINEKFLS